MKLQVAANHSVLSDRELIFIAGGWKPQQVLRVKVDRRDHLRGCACLWIFIQQAVGQHGPGSPGAGPPAKSLRNE